MNYEEHVGDVLEHLLIEFHQFKYKNFMVGCGCSCSTMEVSTNCCRLLLTVDAVAVDKGRGACQVLAKLSK